MHPKFGKRYSFREAAAYLEIPEARLRRLVYRRAITFTRTDPAQTGKLEFYEKDLDAFLDGQRVPAQPTKTVREDSTSTDVDREVRALAERIGAEPIH